MFLTLLFDIQTFHNSFGKCKTIKIFCTTYTKFYIHNNYITYLVSEQVVK